MISLRCARFLLALLLCVAGTPAMAVVVRACTTDVQQGAGTNLAEAIEAGGVITFDCPGPSPVTLLVTRGYMIDGQVRIFGGGRVILKIESGPAFTVTRPGLLQLAGLEIVGGTTPMLPAPPGSPRLFYVAGGTVVLDGTTVKSIAEQLAYVAAGGSLVLTGKSHLSGIRGGLTVDGADLTIAAGSVLERWDSPVKVRKGHVAISAADFDRAKLLLRDCELTINDSKFFNSDVRSRGEDGGALETNCTGTIANSRFSNNKAVNGGALHVIPGSSGYLTITQVEFLNNVALGNGGGAYLSSAAGRLPVGDAPRLSIDLTYATFKGNAANEGGGLYATGVTVRAARFTSNSSVARGGGYFGNGRGSMQRASFVKNTAGTEGGGAFAFASTFSNVLITRNTAPRGAGLFGGNMELVNVTVAENNGTGLDSGSFSAGFRLRNVLVVNNSGGNCALSGPAPAVSAASTSLQFPASVCGAAIPVQDPYLDSLFAPVSGSRARTGGDLLACTSYPVSGKDLYGEPRPQGRSCSIGAVEGSVDRLVFKRFKDPGSTAQELNQQVLDWARQVPR